MLYAQLMAISKGKINPRYGLLVASMTDSVVKAGAEHSAHQRHQKKIPYVTLFDKDISDEENNKMIEAAVMDYEEADKLQK
jgi:hypothetical protein